MLSWCLCVALTLMVVTPEAAWAAPVPSAETGPVPHTERLQDLAKVQRVLEQKLVRERLAALGLTEAEVTARLARLDDAELHEFAQRLDEIGAGGDQCQGADCGYVLAFYLAAILVGLIVYGVVQLVKWVWPKLTAPRPSGS